MKRTPLLALFFMMLGLAAPAQPVDTWVNWGIITAPPDIPPQIDARNFVNSNAMTIIFTNFTVNPELFDTSDTLNFTNVGFMSASAGWQFDTAPAVSGLRHPAQSIYNSGTMFAGAAGLFTTLAQGTANTIFGFTFTTGAKLIGSADTIVNTGTMQVGFNGLLKLTGGDLSLSRSQLNLEGTSAILGGFIIGTGAGSGGGIFDNYWGASTNITRPALQYDNPAPFTSFHTVTQFLDHAYLTLGTEIFFPDNVQTWVAEQIIGTNRTVQIVILREPNPAISNNVYFVPPQSIFGPNANSFDIGVEWIGYGTNLVTGDITTNYLNAIDGYFNPPTTNNSTMTNNFTVDGFATQIPTNFQVFLGGPFFNAFGLTPAPQSSISGIFSADQFGTVTNQYGAYSALVLPFSAQTNDVAGRSVTNLAGRIELTASRVLDLNRTRMADPNTIIIKATNHFAGNENAQAAAAFWDLDLASTNASLTISNLLMPLNRFNGLVNFYRARWTNNTVFGGTTNISVYHVLFVDSQLNTVAAPQINDFYLRNSRNTDVVINDEVDVMRNFQVNARNLTIASNNITDPITYPSPFYQFGSLNFQNSSVLWSTALPNLKNLTNQGVINVQNAAFFGGQHVAPFISANPNDWYDSFVNSGSVAAQGLTIYSHFFENSGFINSGFGPLAISADFASMTNGVLFSSNSPITLLSGTLLTSNSIIATGGSVTLNVANYLDDGSLGNCVQFVTNQSLWLVQGLNLTALPSLSSLLATTITNTTLAYHQVVNVWAGADRGNDPSGFINNAAIGRLILDGEHPDSLFTFQPAGGNNAMYVDYLELDQYATNNANNVYYGINIQPGMKIYYGDAFANGTSIAEKLNGANNGRFVWVSNYNCGFFSSVTLTNPVTGTNYTINAALRISPNIDSDNDGTVNRDDPTPLGDDAAPTCSCPPFTIPPFVVGDNSGFTPGSSTNAISGPEPGQFPGPVPSPDMAPYQTFADVKGSYTGLFSETNGVNVSSAGYFTATTTTKGGVSGKLVMGGKTYSMSATFDANGVANAKVNRGALHSLNVHLKLNLAGGDQITGTISDSHWTSQIIANRQVFDKSHNPATRYTGTYTVDIPGAAPQSGSPAGDGFGTVKIDAGGNVQFAGSLSDGTKITQKSAISGAGYWPMYASVYQGTGCAMGWLELVNHRMGGKVIWIKPAGAQSSAKSYSGGFTNRADAAGLTYTAPARNQQVLSWNSGQAIFSGAQISGLWTNLFYLDLAARQFTPDNSTLKLTITPSSGLFQGSIVNPDTGLPVKFQGVLFQDVNVGLGYFLNANQSGQIYLGPAP